MTYMLVILVWYAGHLDNTNIHKSGYASKAACIADAKVWEEQRLFMNRRPWNIELKCVGEDQQTALNR